MHTRDSPSDLNCNRLQVSCNRFVERTAIRNRCGLELQWGNEFRLGGTVIKGGALETRKQFGVL